MMMHPKIFKFAAIDIGSNAARLLLANVFEQKDSWTSRKASLLRMPVRLGDDAFLSGCISEKKAFQLTKTMTGFKHLVEAFEPRAFMACATSAMREADNGPVLCEQIFEKTGIRIEIIDGKREAEIILENNQREIPGLSEKVLFVDVGGGSTEITLLINGRVIASHSFNIGSIRLSNNLVSGGEWKRMRDWLQRKRSKGDSWTSVGSGGNIKTIFELSNTAFGKPISREKISQIQKYLRGFTVETLVTELGLKPDRADVIVPASDIYNNVMKWSGAEWMHVPMLGLADGMIHVMYKSCKNGQKKLKMKKQSGILPFRIVNKRVEILLVTTSTGKNWTIPKGNVKKKLGPLQSAVEEGWEEAGISGVIQQPHIGKFQLRKRGKLYAVKVFPCRVEKAVKNFPEEKIRRRKWAPAKEAAELVKHAGLKKLLSGVEETILSMNAV